MEQSPIEANSSSANKEISHKQPKCTLSRSQEPSTCHCPEADHSTPLPFFLKIHFILFLHIPVGLGNGLFSSGFPSKILYAPVLFPTHAT